MTGRSVGNDWGGAMPRKGPPPSKTGLHVALGLRLYYNPLISPIPTKERVMPSPITPDLVYQLTSYGSPTLSPDGSRLAFAQSKVDRETMKTRSRVMLKSLPGGDAFAFTQGPRDAAPRFSPNGETIAFLRPDDKGRAQVWTISVSGGEAVRLTNMPGAVSDFAWSPDSDALAVVSDVDPDRPPDDHDFAKDPRIRVARRITYRADDIGWRGASRRHLFTVPLTGGEATQITEGDWDNSGPVWSPDGSRIAFISARRPDREFVAYNEAYVVPAGGGEAALWSQGLSSVGAIAWSPDGERLAVVGSDNDEISAVWQGSLFLIQPGAEPKRLNDDSMRPAAGLPPNIPTPEFRWTGDGRLIFVADSRGESFVCSLPVDGGPVQRITAGGVQYGGITIDKQAQTAVVLALSPDSPGDLHGVDLASGASTPLTDSNADYLTNCPPAIMKKTSLTRDGMEIQSRLLLPPDFDETKKYPLVIDVHGGPHGSFYDAFNPVEQVLATAGYAVLGVNPRGSSTYGAEFLRAVLRDWGGEDYRDIMAAVEETRSLPYVDGDNMGIHGYSYGGYMSAWAIGHDTRFSAAVVGAPCIDLLSMYGTSDIGVSFGERQWGGLRKDNVQAYLDHSPISYADRVETPVLLLHGEADHRCPIEQSEQYFVALQRLGKTVEMARFPGCSHLFLRGGHPKMREEYLARTLAWFNRWLNPQ